jgi:hypothetical protein
MQFLLMFLLMNYFHPLCRLFSDGMRGLQSFVVLIMRLNRIAIIHRSLGWSFSAFCQRNTSAQKRKKDCQRQPHCKFILLHTVIPFCILKIKKIVSPVGAFAKPSMKKIEGVLDGKK